MTEGIDALEHARRELGLSLGELWLRYFGVGGMSTAFQLEAILFGALVADSHDRDVLTVALNERIAELGGDHPLLYSGDAPTDPDVDDAPRNGDR